MTTSVEDRINALFEELVPCVGPAESVAGEIIRAISHIGYRCANDGDHIGVGYGNETCNPAGRYLMAKTNERIENDVSSLWGVYDDDEYNTLLANLEKSIVEFIESNPELKSTPNTDNLWNYRNVEEDVDNSYDDEEDF